MAYQPTGSTAYANPPQLLVSPMWVGRGSTFGSTIGSTLLGGGSVWLYRSTHLNTDVGTSDFISDGLALGMKQGDFVLNVRLTAEASQVHFHRIIAIGSTFVNCSPGLCISSAS